MNDLHDLCDRCYESIENRGILRCNGLDFDMDLPSVSLYHPECYATLSEQDEVPTCVDCINDPCFIRRNLNEL